MKARKSSRKRLAEARANRRSAWTAAITIVSGLALGVLLLFTSPPCLPPQALAAQVLRGDKINPSATTETNLSALTNPNFSATNLPSGLMNNPGLPPAAAVTNELPAFVTVDGDKYRSLSFQQLAAFRFNVTDEMSSQDANMLVATVRVLEQIPTSVKAMNKSAVALTGFMLPIKWSEGLVTDFMLLPNQMGCCYGRMPRINEVVIVNTAGQGVKLLQDIPVSILGTFHVGAVRNNNYLVGIYQMDCERVVEANTLSTK
jgi:hypothetical protein